jgi:hypothetical protein
MEALFFNVFGSQKAKTFSITIIKREAMLDVSFLSKFDWNPAHLEQKKLEVDLKLFRQNFSFEDQMQFQVSGNVLEALCQKAPNCETIRLYKGPLDWTRLYPFSFGLEKRYEEWLIDVYGDKEKTEQRRAVFGVNLLCEYLHRIASFAPDHIQFTLYFDDLDWYAPSYLAQLFSKNRFTHFQIENDPFEGSVGFVLFDDKDYDEKSYKIIDKILKENSQKVRFLPQEMIPELWHNLDALYVIEEKLSKFGKRGIAGFLAAEGVVHYL